MGAVLLRLACVAPALSTDVISMRSLGPVEFGRLSVALAYGSTYTCCRNEENVRRRAAVNSTQQARIHVFKP